MMTVSNIIAGTFKSYDNFMTNTSICNDANYNKIELPLHSQ